MRYRPRLDIAFVCASLLLAIDEATLALPPSTCAGDCNRDHSVTIDELVLQVRRALGDSRAACSDPSPGSGIVGLVRAVNSGLHACGIPVTYRLTDASTILRSVGDGSAPSIERLSGTLTVVDTLDPPPNCWVSLSVVDVDFRSEQNLAITEHRGKGRGCGEDTAAGCLHVLSFDFPHTLRGGITLAIGGQTILFIGEADEENYPDRFPPIRNLVLCGRGSPLTECQAIQSGAAAGYYVTINAVVEQGTP